MEEGTAYLNRLMADSDAFYAEFSALDNRVYLDGAISRKNKELMGLAISVVTRCHECIAYHMGGCLTHGATKAEIQEAVKVGVVTGGSATYPSAKLAFSLLNEAGRDKK